MQNTTTSSRISLKFPYSRVSIQPQYRPWDSIYYKFHPLLKIGLGRGNNWVKTEAYIDTGAQFCFFNNDFARQLGIKNYKDTPIKTPLSGIGGMRATNTAYFHELKLAVFKDIKHLKITNSWQRDIKIGFLENPIAFSGILGAHGFLDNFTFMANIPNGYFEISPIFDVV